MEALARIVARVVDVVAIAAFTAMFGCVLAQVAFRYVLNDPLTWSDELARYLFVWCSFLGWIIAARHRSHLGISLPEGWLGPRAQAALGLVGALAAIAFAALLGWQGWRIAARNLDVDTTTLFFTFGVVYAIVPIASLLVGAHALSDARRNLRRLAGSGRA